MAAIRENLTSKCYLDDLEHYLWYSLHLEINMATIKLWLAEISNY